MATAPDLTMSSTDPDNLMLRFDVDVFVPLLKEDICEQPPPFTIDNPLTEADFSTHPNDDNFLADLNGILPPLSTGFGTKPTTLNCEHWIHASA